MEILYYLRSNIFADIVVALVAVLVVVVAAREEDLPNLCLQVPAGFVCFYV